MSDPLPDYVLRNPEAWDLKADNYAFSGEREWAAKEPTWGIFGVPETQIRLLPSNLFGMYRYHRSDGGVECHLKHGDILRLLRASSFEIEDLIEIQAPEGATTSYPFVSAEWAHRWPCEEVWKARKRS